MARRSPRNRPCLEGPRQRRPQVRRQRNPGLRQPRHQKPQHQAGLRTSPSRTTSRRYPQKRTAHHGDYGGDQSGDGTESMSANWRVVSLGELIRLERRPVDVIADRQYQEIGIYCFGRGIFHKSPRSGLEVGDKELYELREGDLILPVTFAWEGAIALCSKAEHGLFGSTRYPT